MSLVDLKTSQISLSLMRGSFALFFFLCVLTSIAQRRDQTLWTVAWSPDDALIAVGSNDGYLRILAGDSYELIKAYSTGTAIVSRVKWHPTQNKLGVITQSVGFKAKILDLDSDSWIDLEGLEYSLRGLDWNHNGDLLAVSEFEGEVSIYDLQGKRSARFLADDKSVTGIDWHPSENILTAVGSTVGLYTHLGDTLLQFSPRKEEIFLLCVEWHPSGKFFATGDYGTFDDATDKRIDFWSPGGEQLVQMGNSLAEYRNIRWSPDGRYLASANNALSLWDTTGQLVDQTEATKDYLWGVDWNSDGSLLITGSSEGVFSVWDSNLQLITEITFE